jgi:FkbM family methyltransferase
VGPTGRVISFEADPEAESRLRENIAYNKFNWVSVEHKAVWSNSAPVFFLRADPIVSPDRGLGHVVSGPGADTIRINSTSLDDYVRASGSPDFIKCDVEGAEIEVFRGAQELLTSGRPGILCEMHGQESRRVLLEEFARLRYSCQTIDETHILAMPT